MVAVEKRCTFGKSKGNSESLISLLLKSILDSYIKLAPDAKLYSDQCLNITRWDGNIVLIIMDAAFTSTGLHYFNAVVPGLNRFKTSFIETGKVLSIDDIYTINERDMSDIWRNNRTWHVAISIINVLSYIKQNNNLSDSEAFKYWADTSNLNNWQANPIGRIRGVGINTFQYLRMMGGIDTVMPDRIVKRVFAEIMSGTDIAFPSMDIEFIHFVEHIAEMTGYRANELCWMAWLLQKVKAVR